MDTADRARSAPVRRVRCVRAVPRRSAGARLRSGVDLVNLGVTVTDRREPRHRSLARRFRDRRGRPEADDQLVRAGRPRQPRRRRCTSGCCSTSARAWARTSRFTKTAAVKFLNTLTRAVDVTVVDFDTEVRPRATARTSSPRLDRAHPRSRRRPAGPRSTTPSASISTAPPARTAARSCCSTPTAATRAARRRFSELLDLLKASDVTVYAIGELEHSRARRGARSADRAAADCRDHRRPGVLPDLGQGARRDLREGRSPRFARNTRSATSSTNEKTRRHLAEGRDQGRRARTGATPRPRAQGLFRAHSAHDGPGSGYGLRLRPRACIR